MCVCYQFLIELGAFVYSAWRETEGFIGLKLQNGINTLREDWEKKMSESLTVNNQVLLCNFEFLNQ